MASSKMPIHIFIDGSARNNGKWNSTGASSAYFGKNDPRNISEIFMLTPITNNRTELYAIIKAITQYITSIDYESNMSKGIKHKLIICSDSLYTINSVSKWIYGWKKRDWKTANGKDVKNRELIEWIYNLIDKTKRVLDIEFKHVRGHKDPPKDKSSYEYYLWEGNYYADKMARETSKAIVFKG